jgi:hypothetical protein
MTCRVEVFVRSGHTIDLALEDGEDRTFAQALREAWASPEAIEGSGALCVMSWRLGREEDSFAE